MAGFGQPNQLTFSTSTPAFATTSSSSSATSLLFGKQTQMSANENKPTFANLFSRNQAENTTAPSLFGNRLSTTTQQQQQLSVDKTKMFEQPTRASSASVYQDANLENIFQSIFLYFIRDFCSQFLMDQKLIDSFCKNEINDLVESTVGSLVKSIAVQQLNQYRYT